MPAPALLLLALAADVTALSLDEAVERAREADTRQELSRFDEENAQLAAHQGLSRVLPAASISSTLTQNPGEIAVGEGADRRVLTPFQQYNAGGTATLDLLRGSAIPDAIAGYTDAAATEQEQREAREALDADVATVYVQLAQAQASEEVLVRQQATAEVLLRLAEARVRAGEAVALEVEDARGEVLRAEAALARARGVTEQVNAQLALRLGLAPDARIRAACEACIVAPASDDRERGDVVGLRLRADAAQMRGWGAWMEFAPTVQLVGNVRLQQPTFFNPNYLWGNAQLVLTWSLFEGGGRWFSRSRDGVSANRARRVADLAEREREVQIVQARSGLRAASVAQEAAAARAEIAGRALSQAELRYREGLLSSFGVQEAARRKADAEAAAVDAAAARVLAALQLRRALGLPVLGEGAS